MEAEYASLSVVKRRLQSCNYRGFTTRYKKAGETQKQKGQTAVNTNVEKRKAGEVVEQSWSYHYQHDGRNSSWPKATTSSFKHGGWWLVLWHRACSSASEAGTLASPDEFTAEEAAGWMQKCTGAVCVFRSSQNSADDISSFSWTAVQNIQTKQLKSFSAWRGGISSTAKSITWSHSDWAALHLLKTRWYQNPLLMSIGQSPDCSRSLQRALYY